MIRMAIDITGNRVWIDHAKYQSLYCCQECGGRLVPKMGKIRIPHFAHYDPQNEIERECNERNKRYEMSEWHRSWREKFPEECREVVFTNSLGEKRRADIFIREWNTVIEFQHSKIDVEDFVGRTLFYLKQGIKVVWLYDMTSYTEKGEFIFAGRSDNYCWYIMDKKIYVQVFEIWDRILQLGKNQMCFFHIYQKNGQYEFYNKVEVIFQNQGDLIEAMVGPVYHPALRECQKSPYSFGRFYQPVVLTKYSIFSKLSKLSNIRINDLK